ncbi:MAG: aryl-sulfate sulfotransferase [Erysipelotrichaceae bacterium]|nr:aryl-sulfate sulfotransferase [Erysipelotrichaceae bacterium]MDY5251291.1 aryl-sulfate sulfotransferase [Erysipelotrichaceae bacterium]
MKRRIMISSMLVIMLMISGCSKVQNESQETSRTLLEATTSMIDQQASKEITLSGEGYTFDDPNVILDPYGVSPLSALVMFETNQEVAIEISVQGKDDNTTIKNKFAAATQHYLPIYGLYPDQENEVSLRYEDEQGEHINTLIIKTDKLPEDFVMPNEVYANKEKLGNELYFFTPANVGYNCAYDVNGDVRWYLNFKTTWDNARLVNGHLLLGSDRLINDPYYNTGMYEIDLLGKVYKEYVLPGGYHHDYDELPNGNLLVCTDDFESGKGTVEDHIVEIDRDTGEIIKTYDLTNILKMDDGKSENWTEYDWFHNNSVWYDEATNSITLSGRHQDAIINIDYDSQELNWIIGDPTNWSEEYQKYFFTPVGENFEWQWSQHAAMITPEGYVFVLDNGNNKSKIKEAYVPATNSYTRGVMYKIDTEKMTIEQVWEYGKERGSEFYSPYISDVDYLNKDHYIVHSGGIVYVDGVNSNQPAGFSEGAELLSDTVELLDDEVIFEIKIPTNYYRVEKMSLYQDDQHFKAQQGQLLGSFNETKPTEIKKVAKLEARSIDELASMHDIEIVKEYDRLKVKGQFYKDNKVNIVLVNDDQAYYYNVRISKKPYTALCVFVFSEKEDKEGISVTKYINDVGLNGKYDIYLEVDGTLYDSGQYIDVE